MLYYLIQIGSDIMLVKSTRPIPDNADLSHGWPSVGRYPLLDTALFCNYFKDKGLDEALKDSKPYKLPDDVEIFFQTIDNVEYPFYKGIEPCQWPSDEEIEKKFRFRGDNSNRGMDKSRFRTDGAKQLRDELKAKYKLIKR